MPSLTITLPKLHSSQQRVKDSQARYRVLACGRRWGKTRLGSALCVEMGLRGGRAWWVAPSYKVANVGWRLISRLGGQIPGTEIRRGDRAVNFPTGGEVMVRSADNPDSLRGEGLDFVVLDECAFMKGEAWTEAIRPALSDRQGGAMFISTPSGRNWFWRLYQRARDHGDWAAWQLPTSDNPYIPDDEIEAARDSLPEVIFEQEYLAVFLENEGAVFRNIAACLHAPDSQPKDHSGHRLVAGVDWGKQNDYTAISIGCATCRQEVALDRMNKIDYALQRGLLAEGVNKWSASYILAESNAMGEPNLEMLQREGLPVAGFTTGATTKPPLIENMVLVFEREEWQFLDIPVATAELEAYERKVSPVTGRSQYSAPDGLHDDTVMARALMLRAAGDGSDLILW